jgi:hypothetical protein
MTPAPSAQPTPVLGFVTIQMMDGTETTHRFSGTLKFLSEFFDIFIVRTQDSRLLVLLLAPRANSEMAMINPPFGWSDALPLDIVIEEVSSEVRMGGHQIDVLNKAHLWVNLLTVTVHIVSGRTHMVIMDAAGNNTLFGCPVDWDKTAKIHIAMNVTAQGAP